MRKGLSAMEGSFLYLNFISEKNKTNFHRLYYKNETSYRITGKVFIIYSKHRFHGDDDAAIPALTAYTGIVFKRIDPASFTDADFEYAQRHLNITSFLYGLLRPLDAIRTYRLEGDAVLPGRGDETMFSYWQSRLTDDLLGRIHADDGILVNLASGEMKRLFDWKRVCREARVITPEFRVREGDRLKTVVVYTKMCRGEMTRHILKNRIADPATLRSFEWEGFRLDPALSKGDDWVFTL